jgi:hypothetical protein
LLRGLCAGLQREATLMLPVPQSITRLRMSPELAFALE